MNRGISDFALSLVFRDWGLKSVAITGLGIGAALVAHQQTEWWNLSHTLVLIGYMLLMTIIGKCIAFSFSSYQKEFPRLHAVRFVKGEGLNSGNTIIVLSHSEGISKGQLVTLFCESSGAKQPILVAEVNLVTEKEIQAVSITNFNDHEIRKYFEEESRFRMLFAEPKVVSDDIASQRLGERNE